MATNDKKLKVSEMLAVIAKNPLSNKARKYATRISESGYPKALHVPYKGKDEACVVLTQAEQQALLTLAKALQKAYPVTGEGDDDIEVE